MSKEKIDKKDSSKEAQPKTKKSSYSKKKKIKKISLTELPMFNQLSIIQ